MSDLGSCVVCGGNKFRKVSWEQYSTNVKTHPRYNSQNRKIGESWEFHGRSSTNYDNSSPLTVTDAKRDYKDDKPVECKNCGAEQYG